MLKVMREAESLRRRVLLALFLAARVQSVDGRIEGVRIDTTHDMGRVLVATRAFSCGEIVLREKPVLVWESSNLFNQHLSFIDNYFRAGICEQAIVHDMYCPREVHGVGEMHVTEALLRAQEQSDKSTSSLPPDEIRCLLKRAAANSIEIMAEGDCLQQDNRTCGLFPMMPMKAALFEYGSKMSHSCNPNTIPETFPASLPNESSTAGYRAIRPIKAGEQITFSYVGNSFEKLNPQLLCEAGPRVAFSSSNIFTMPTRSRRKFVLEQRGFVCRCSRCDGPDVCRPLKCPRDGCEDYALLDGKIEEWSCRKCGTLEKFEMTTVLDFEERMDVSWKELWQAAGGGVAHEPPKLPLPADFETLIKHGETYLGPTHFVLLKALTALSKVCNILESRLKDFKKMGLPRNFFSSGQFAQKVAQMQSFFDTKMPGHDVRDTTDPRDHFTAAELLTKAVRARMLVATRCACITEGCVGTCSSNNHFPGYFCHDEVLFATEDLFQLPLDARDGLGDAFDFVVRHVPMLSHFRYLKKPALPARAMIFERHMQAHGIQIGTRVRIDGLKNRRELNGKKGTVVAVDPGNERLQVDVFILETNSKTQAPQRDFLSLHVKLGNLVSAQAT